MLALTSGLAMSEETPMADDTVRSPRKIASFGTSRKFFFFFLGGDWMNGHNWSLKVLHISLPVVQPGVAWANSHRAPELHWYLCCAVQNCVRLFEINRDRSRWCSHLLQEIEKGDITSSCAKKKKKYHLNRQVSKGPLGIFIKNDKNDILEAKQKGIFTCKAASKNILPVLRQVIFLSVTTLWMTWWHDFCRPFLENQLASLRALFDLMAHLWFLEKESYYIRVHDDLTFYPPSKKRLGCLFWNFVKRIMPKTKNWRLSSNEWIIGNIFQP